MLGVCSRCHSQLWVEFFHHFIFNLVTNPIYSHAHVLCHVYVYLLLTINILLTAILVTFCSMVTTVVLFQGLKASASQIITIVMAFLVICMGITILQMSKVDPTQLKLDRRSTILLQASRQNTEAADEKLAAGFEDPGIDTLRGSFGAVGSIIRANTARRMSRSGRATSNLRNRASGGSAPHDVEADPSTVLNDKIGGMIRHQLYDAPVPRPDSMDRVSSLASAASERKPTIKFDSQEVVHQYHPTGKGDAATHEHRNASRFPYPPLPNLPHSPLHADISETNLISESSITSSPRQISHPKPTPPTMTASFFSPPKEDPFDNTPTAASFSTIASASDSSESNTPTSWYSGESDEDRIHNHRKGRSYPKGDDDRDESVRLFHGSRPSLDDGDESSGIRLVKPSSDTRF